MYGNVPYRHNQSFGPVMEVKAEIDQNILYQDNPTTNSSIQSSIDVENDVASRTTNLTS